MQYRAERLWQAASSVELRASSVALDLASALAMLCARSLGPAPHKLRFAPSQRHIDRPHAAPTMKRFLKDLRVRDLAT